METNISCGFNKIIREKIAAYRREEHQLKQRLSALPAIFRHRFKSCEMHIKGFNYFLQRRKSPVASWLWHCTKRCRQKHIPG